MIKELNIENFQSHKNSTLEFDKGVNIIIGKSDVGKSAIRRALELVIQNKPNGDDYRSWWGGDTKVTLKTFDNQEVVRLRTNSKNQYFLGDIEFNAFGQSVPEEIQKALNLNSINFQSQLDSPFLLSDTPGQVAAHFNKIARLDKIDIATANVNKYIKKIEQSISGSELNVEKKEKELEEFVDLVSFEKELEAVEEKTSKLNNISSGNTELIRHYSKIEMIRAEITFKKECIKPEKPIELILAQYAKKNEVALNLQMLKKEALSIHSLKEEIKEAENVISAEASIDKILEDYSTLLETQLKLTQLNKLYLSIDNLNKSLDRALKRLEILEKEFETAFPDICPLCNTQLS